MQRPWIDTGHSYLRSAAKPYAANINFGSTFSINFYVSQKLSYVKTKGEIMVKIIDNFVKEKKWHFINFQMSRDRERLMK